LNDNDKFSLYRDIFPTKRKNAPSIFTDHESWRLESVVINIRFKVVFFPFVCLLFTRFYV
jgi:hypothetical protein